MKCNRLEHHQLATIIRCFCEDLTATATAAVVGTSRNTVNSYFNTIRQRIFQQSLKESRQEFGEFELDELYFGSKRIRSKRRGAAGKKLVFGLLKRGENVFVTVVPDCSKECLMPVIQGQVLEGSTIHTDGRKTYDLIFNGYKHCRVFHSENETESKPHADGIESFWSYAKHRLEKFNGFKSDKFMIHLKECEFRFNHRDGSLDEIIRELMNNYFSCEK